MLEDLSGNGTFVNEAFVGRNKRRELHDGDEIALLDEARCIFRYPRSRISRGFNQKYKVQEQLGKGHFATVYLAVEKTSGMKFAVKKFEKRTGPGERSRVEGLQQEIAVLMGVSHPNVLCLKETFDEADGVYIVLELAVEGELFNCIVMKSKLSETETRKVFIQLFQGIKYLVCFAKSVGCEFFTNYDDQHERNIVHRDIKPENILLVDKDLTVKLADFGLAKIIGEESFTTTLCGTPSCESLFSTCKLRPLMNEDVAPEILESSNHRRYTRAVDVWSLGVVLYICLCGFPPFSDELYSAENPLTLADQIKQASFDYPSPYWDPVSDMALDLIDRMLTVRVDKRITVDECLEHPWITQREFDPRQRLDPSDSTDGLTGALGLLDFSKRKPQRERTLLSSFNDVRVSHTIPMHADGPSLKIFSKQSNRGQRAGQNKQKAVENGAAQAREQTKPGRAEDFMQLGSAKDAPLFGNDSGSVYAPSNRKA